MNSLADVCVAMLCVSVSMCLMQPLWLSARRAWVGRAGAERKPRSSLPCLAEADGGLPGSRISE
jgi:hypothetical protein